jgi:Leucine-rich repeat (LRR) protein
MEFLGDDEILDESYLSRLKIHPESATVTLTLNTSLVSLLGLHELMPNLMHLVLDSSVISSLRDLGTRLTRVTLLSVNECNLFDLDGIGGAFPNLKELSACNNLITDVTSLAMHSCLEV